VKGLSCSDADEFTGFSFSHIGTWKTGGVAHELKSKGACAHQCHRDKACVGFAHHKNKAGEGCCTTFGFEANAEGPQKDMRSFTYSKCSMVEGRTEEECRNAHDDVEARAPVMPSSLVQVNRCANDYNATGYVHFSSGWVWQSYAQLRQTSNNQTCMQACDSMESCIVAVFRPLQKSGGECFLYNGLARIENSTMRAYQRCRKGEACNVSKEFDYQIFQFSHSGSWQGGKKYEGVGLRACGFLCVGLAKCTALSWQPDGEVCNIFDDSVTHSASAPMPSRFALGFAKCASGARLDAM